MNVSPSQPEYRVLVIEDEPDIAALISMHLAAIPVAASCVRDGRVGYNKACEEHWDLLVLDLRLPSMRGLDICRELRASGNPVLILMLTALNSEVDRVLGLELGADDYLTKPFSVMELRARVKALLRRVRHAGTPATALPGTGPMPHHGAGPLDKHPDTSNIRQTGNLTIDRNQRRVWYSGETLSLTRREFDLLWHFASHPGQVFTRSELLEAVWGYGHQGYDHTVNSHINRLRNKLHDDRSSPKVIETVWGVGYRYLLN